MKLTAQQLDYWNAYVATLKEAPVNPHVTAGMAGNAQVTDGLLALYLSGKKTAGSGLVKDYKFENEPLPQVGNYWMILDSQKTPRCLVQTVRVEFHQFHKIPAYVAIAEGEGDLSVLYWQKIHTEFFAPFLDRLGIVDLQNEMCVVEFFEVVWK